MEEKQEKVRWQIKWTWAVVESFVRAVTSLIEWESRTDIFRERTILEFKVTYVELQSSEVWHTDIQAASTETGRSEVSEFE